MSTNNTHQLFAEDELPTFQDVLLARKTIAPHFKPTPLHHYPALDALLGAEVYVKHENYSATGAFKMRGGINFMAHLPPEERAKGVVTASTGNHGQSIAYAARRFGIRAVIVVPEKANPVRNPPLKGMGLCLAHGPELDQTTRKGKRYFGYGTFGCFSSPSPCRIALNICIWVKEVCYAQQALISGRGEHYGSNARIRKDHQNAK